MRAITVICSGVSRSAPALRLDTIPIPGDASTVQIAAILTDVAALSIRLQKQWRSNRRWSFTADLLGWFFLRPPFSRSRSQGRRYNAV